MLVRVDKCRSSNQSDARIEPCQEQASSGPIQQEVAQETSTSSGVGGKFEWRQQQLLAADQRRTRKLQAEQRRRAHSSNTRNGKFNHRPTDDQSNQHKSRSKSLKLVRISHSNGRPEKSIERQQRNQQPRRATIEWRSKLKLAYLLAIISCCCCCDVHYLNSALRSTTSNSTLKLSSYWLMI